MLKPTAWVCAWAWLVVAAAVPAATTDRHLAPDQYPNNVVKIIRTTNKAQITSYVPVVFPLHNVNPFSVIRFLRRPVEVEEGLLFTFVNPDGRSGLVLYAVPEYMIDSLRELVQAIDRPGLTTSSGDARFYRQLRHRRADFSDPSFLTTAASFLTGNQTEFAVDPGRNALYFGDAPSGSAALNAALTDFLDKPTAMVQLLVKIYEMEAVNDGTLGLDFAAWINGPGSNLFALGAFAEHGGFDRAENPVLQPLGSGAYAVPRRNFTATGWNFAYQYNVPSAFFDFLAVKGKARVLTESRLAVLNTYSGHLSTGDKILYYKTTNVSDENGRRSEPFSNNNDRLVTPEVASEDASLVVDVVPQIGTEQIELALTIQWADFNGLDDKGTPQIARRKLATTLRTALNEEIVIGGINRQVRMQVTRRVPVLGAIPILGYLFGSETTQAQNSEMVVAIQPLGVMDYASADYTVDAASALVMKKATGDEPIVEPALPWGFDQLYIDPEKRIVE